MTVARGNGGKIKLVTRSGYNTPIFVELRFGAPHNFSADLVADPSDPAQRAAAVNSELEQVVEHIQQYGTILCCAPDGGYLDVMFDYNTAFTDPATSQAVWDYFDDNGWNIIHVIASEFAYQYDFQPAT